MNMGCPNCEEYLELAGHSDVIQDCTSQVFEGLITINDPASSWVAKWQRLEAYVPGVYAVKVTGIVRSFMTTNIREETESGAVARRCDFDGRGCGCQVYPVSSCMLEHNS